MSSGVGPGVGMAPAFGMAGPGYGAFGGPGGAPPGFSLVGGPPGNEGAVYPYPYSNGAGGFASAHHQHQQQQQQQHFAYPGFGVEPTMDKDIGSSMYGDDMQQEGGMGPMVSVANIASGPAGPPNHSNLYVKNIPEEVTEEQLQALFRVYGDVDSCRLVRNLKTGASRGYGFVRYSNVEEAMMAISALNGYITALGGVKLEVKFADSDAGPKNPKPTHGSTPSDNLYVRNLPPSWMDHDLVPLFAPFGDVIESRLLNAGSDFSTRGIGALVRMGTVEQAMMAIDSLNGRLIPGGNAPLTVRYADSAEDKARRQQRHMRGPSRYSPYQPPGAGSGSTSRGSNSPSNAPHLSSTNSLPAGFTGFNATGLPDHSGGQGPGRMDSAVLQDNTNSVWQQPQQPAGNFSWSAVDTTGINAPAGNANTLTSTGLTSLYVKNLPPEADKLYLYEKFAIHGAIASVKVLADEQGVCKGVGFVNFVEHDAALEAIRALHGLKVSDKQLHVSLQTHRSSHRGGHH